MLHGAPRSADRRPRRVRRGRRPRFRPVRAGVGGSRPHRRDGGRPHIPSCIPGARTSRAVVTSDDLFTLRGRADRDGRWWRRLHRPRVRGHPRGSRVEVTLSGRVRCGAAGSTRSAPTRFFRVFALGATSTALPRRVDRGRPTMARPRRRAPASNSSLRARTKGSRRGSDEGEPPGCDARTGDGGRTLLFDTVLFATGRRPALAGARLKTPAWSPARGRAPTRPRRARTRRPTCPWCVVGDALASFPARRAVRGADARRGAHGRDARTAALWRKSRTSPLPRRPQAS